MLRLKISLRKKVKIMAVLKCNKKWEVGIKPEELRIAFQGCKVETAEMSFWIFC